MHPADGKRMLFVQADAGVRTGSRGRVKRGVLVQGAAARPLRQNQDGLFSEAQVWI